MIQMDQPAGQQPQAGQQVLAGQQQLAGQNPVATATAQALNNFAQIHNQYQAPLTSTPSYQPTASPSPEVLQQIGQLMGSVQVPTPHPDSPLVNGASGGQAQQIKYSSDAGGVLRGIWDNTLGGYLHLWQTNPGAAAAETAVGLAAGAATVFVPELALPVWAGFALMSAPTILPRTVSSLAEAWQNPNDSTVTQALINLGTAGLTIGSPIKAFRGLGATRAILEDGTKALQTQHTVAGAADEVLSISKLASQAGERVGDVRELVDPTKGVEQYELVPQTLGELESEILARTDGRSPIEIGDDTVERLRQSLQLHGQLQRRVEEAAGGTSDEVAGLATTKKELSAFEQNDLIPAQKEFAHRYGYVLAREDALPRMAYDELNSIPLQARAAVDRSFRAIWGVLHGAGEGHGWDGVSDGVVHTDFAENLAEAMARGMAGGGLEHAESVLGTELLSAGRRLGIADDRMEAVYRAMEGDSNAGEHYWGALSASERYLASKLHATFGIMTNYAYKHGHIEMPLSRYVPRIVQRDDVEYGRPGNAFLRNPGNVDNRSWVADDWGVANEMTDLEHHPDELLSLRPLGDRLRQAVRTREQFQQREDQRAEAFKQAAGHREMLRQPGVGDALQTARRTLGQLTKDLIPKTETKLEEAAQRIDDLERRIPSLDHYLSIADRGLAALKGKRGKVAERAELRAFRERYIRELRPATRELKGLKDQHSEWTASLARWKSQAVQVSDDFVRSVGDESARALLSMDRDALTAIAQGKHPGGRKLLTGYRLPQVAFGRFLRQMNQTRYREAWQSIARTVNDRTIKMAYGAHAPISVQEINLMDADKRPIAVPGDLPSGVPGAMLEGYVQVMPSMGRPGSLNYQSPIFARADVAARYKELAQQARSSSELKTSFSRGVYGLTVGFPKRLIMGSPAWHGKNVTGRYMALLLDQPTMAASALGRVLKERFTNPEAYYQTKLDHWMDGGVPANRHNVHDQLNHLEQQMTGQRTFGGALKSAAGAIPNLHAKLAEGWFWKTIDDVGTAAYLVQKHKIMSTRSWASDRVAGMLAAEHANNVTGMVNPLYMGKLWKYGRQMAMFAPNWWTSFNRMAAQSVPGSARISEWLSRHPRLSALDPVKMHSLDIRQRKELVRSMRSYFLTYMAAGMATHDMMNVVLSGHHTWDNGKGHEWDLQTDLSHAPQGDPETTGVKHAYMSGDPFFSQMADLMNVIGLGHDWGFLHQMQGDGYRQADAMHKIGIIAGALGTGLQQRAAGKAGLPLQEAVGLGLGVDPYRLLKSGQAVQIPRSEALVGLLPAGSQAQVAMDDQRRLETRLAITGDASSLAQLQQLQSGGELPGGVPWGPVAGALKGQFLGLPSLYYTGDEAPAGYAPLSNSEMTQYLQQRQQVLTKKRTLSEQLMNGSMSPYDWVRENEIESARYQQLLSDTFGNSSTEGQLWQAYDKLNKKYNLDNPNLSQSDFYNMLDQRNAEWDAQLSAFSPQAQAAYWEAHTSTWTDADYLYDLSKQTKNAVAASIDGEGGQHIRQAQSRLSGQGLPLTTKSLDDLRKQDPYLWTYYNVLKQMGSNTLLGSMVSAFSNPFASFTVMPDDEAQQMQDLVQSGVLKSGTYVRQSTLGGLATAARGVSAADAPEGGRLPLSPEGQQFGAGMTAQEAAQILQQQGSSLDPRIVQLLEALTHGQPVG